MTSQVCTLQICKKSVTYGHKYIQTERRTDRQSLLEDACRIKNIIYYHILDQNYQTIQYESSKSSHLKTFETPLGSY